MSVLKILQWVMTSNSVITACLLLFFAISLLFMILRGVSR